ncbi:MAG TPA: AsmA family protein [Cellvibrio sp.]|nr:AsmA family protein [Cellvibrio sp.]
MNSVRTSTSKSKALKIFAMIIATLFFVLALIILAIVLFAEPLIKSLSEKEGSARLDRELVIEGAFDIDWHWRYTRVHVEKIRLSNARNYPDPNMLTIETLDFDFKPLKLLLGRLEFGQIQLDKPFLLLEKKSLEDNNWTFPVFSQAKVATEVVAADNRHDFPIIHQLEVKGGRLLYRDAVKGMTLDLTLKLAKGEGGSAVAGADTADLSNGFTLSGTGTMQKEKFTLTARGGSLETLRDSTLDYPLILNIAMGATKVAVKGTFKDPIALTGINASLNISGDTLSDIFYLTAIPLPPTPPYKLQGQLKKTGGVWSYEKFSGEVGGSDLSGDLSYDTSKPRGFLKATLVSNVLDSRDLGGFIGLPPSGENAAPEQRQEAAEKKASPKLIPDVPLKLERLRGTDLDVTLKAAKIEAPSLPFKGMEVRFDLNHGLLKLDPLNVILADGTIDGKIAIDAGKDIPPMNMDLNFRQLSLGQFFANTRFAKTTQGYFGGRANLAGSGASLADVLASSNGELTVLMTEGKISKLLIEGADLDIAQALPLFLGSDKPTKIRCGLTDFAVNDGVLTSKAVVLDTNDSLLVGNVKIDLKREIINAKLDAKPKDASLFSAQTPIVLSGQLKSPSLGIDAKKASTRGAAAVALGALLTPFAALLPFIERGDAEHADCRALINSAGK